MIVLLVASAVLVAGCVGGGSDGGPTADGAGADGADTDSVGDYEVEVVANGLTHPWGMAFLPNDTRMLVTERSGALVTVDREEGRVETVEGTPEVFARNQGGMLDVELHPD